MHPTPVGIGWIEVVTGCMFSGKTEELIRRIRRAQYAQQKVVVFKPNLDTRYSRTHVVSHDDKALESFVIADAAEMVGLARDAQVVGIDEGQFFWAGPDSGRGRAGQCRKAGDRRRAGSGLSRTAI